MPFSKGLELALALGEGSSLIRETMRDLTTKGTKKILLNLSDVSYIDSTGIAGAAVKLPGLTKHVKDILQITRLYTVFEPHEDEAEAILSFAQEEGSVRASRGQRCDPVAYPTPSTLPPSRLRQWVRAVGSGSSLSPGLKSMLAAGGVNPLYLNEVAVGVKWCGQRTRGHVTGIAEVIR